MRRTPRTAILGMALLCALPLGSVAVAAQTAPPIHGVTGTVATDATIRGEREAGRAIAEGAEKVVDGVKKILPGGKTTPQNPLEGLIEGSRVVVREAAKGDGDVPTTEGVIVDVNRRRNQITIRLADRKTQTLRVTTPEAGADVVVSFTDSKGAKIARDFKRVSDG
jgi:hypothetical protein